MADVLQQHTRRTSERQPKRKRQNVKSEEEEVEEEK